jgi:hypothetical protein
VPRGVNHCLVRAAATRVTWVAMETFGAVDLRIIMQLSFVSKMVAREISASVLIGARSLQTDPRFASAVIASAVIARSGATKQPPRSWRLLRCARDDRGADEANPNLSCSNSVLVFSASPAP